MLNNDFYLISSNSLFLENT